MRTRIFSLLTLCVTLTAVATPLGAAGLADISNADGVAGLKAALNRGSQIAIRRLGVENGFFGDERFRIPLPESLRKAERLMRKFGMGKQADELVLRMNRAAEAAVPEAKTLLVEAVKGMSIGDAKSILTGGEDAATQYFKRTTSESLARKFLPIVSRMMEHVQLAEKYNEFAEKGSRFGLVKKEDVRLEDYVTRKALDGLFALIAEEEKKLRQDPVGSASGIIRKVFGALKL